MLTSHMTKPSFTQTKEIMLPTPDLNFQYTGEMRSFDKKLKNLVDYEFPSLSASSFLDMVITGLYNIQPIDSRFAYEFNGGHVIN